MLKKISSSEIPRRERKSESRFEATTDWKRLKKDLDAGLSESDARQVGLTPEDMATVGLSSRRSIQRFIQKYIRVNKMPYVVSCLRRGEIEWIFIEHKNSPHQREKKAANAERRARKV